MKLNREICSNCHRVFVKEREEDTECCPCKNAPLPLKKNGHVIGKVPSSISLRRSPGDPRQLFLKEKKPRKKSPSIDSLIKKQEYKRVFGKNAWTHYLKGRKWDRI